MFGNLRFCLPNNIKFGLKWIHMAQYELILRLDGALWLRIIFKPLLTPKMVINKKLDQHKSKLVGVALGYVFVFWA